MHPDPDRLREIPLCEGIGTDQLEQVASWFDVEEHPAGTRLTRAGASGYAFFILEEGHARVEVDGAAVNQLSTADVFADTEVRVLAMFGTRFDQLLALAPEVADRLETLARRRPAG